MVFVIVWSGVLSHHKVCVHNEYKQGQGAALASATVPRAMTLVVFCPLPQKSEHILGARVLNNSFCQNFWKFVFCHNSEVWIIGISEFAKFEYRITKYLVTKRKTAFPPKNIADGLHYVVAKKYFEVNSNHEQKLWDEAPLIHLWKGRRVILCWLKHITP